MGLPSSPLSSGGDILHPHCPTLFQMTGDVPPDPRHPPARQQSFAPRRPPAPRRLPAHHRPPAPRRLAGCPAVGFPLPVVCPPRDVPAPPLDACPAVGFPLPVDCPPCVVPPPEPRRGACPAVALRDVGHCRPCHSHHPCWLALLCVALYGELYSQRM
jgi:hypothetical protein